MLLRNVANQSLLIGPLLAIADGAAQTSGASIAVRKDGADAGSPAGTLSHVADGVWQYVPAQGETDARHVGLILSKSGAAAQPLNVLTTRIPLDAAGGKVPATLAASDVSGNLPVDKTGYALTSDYPTSGDFLTGEEAGGIFADTPVAIKVGGITTASYASGAAPLTALPSTPPANYATASAVADVKADTGKVAGLIETASGTDRFKATALATAPAGSGSVDVNAIVAAINTAGVRLRADGLDSIVVEVGVNARQAMAVNAAALAGKVSGAGTGTVTIKGANNNTTRVVATTDSVGNRTAVTLTLPG